MESIQIDIMEIEFPKFTNLGNHLTLGHFFINDFHEVWELEKMNFKNFIELKMVIIQNKLMNRNFYTDIHHTMFLYRLHTK